MWRGNSPEGNLGAATEGNSGELGGQGNWGLEDAPGLLARASLPIMPAWPSPLASSALTLLLGALTSLFLWYCYRLGSQDMQALGAGSQAGGGGEKGVVEVRGAAGSPSSDLGSQPSLGPSELLQAQLTEEGGRALGKIFPKKEGVWGSGKAHTTSSPRSAPEGRRGTARAWK